MKNFYKNQASPGSTVPMKLKNMAFLLNRLHRDCHPLQFIRELTHNSIQAIERKGGSGEIIWDFDKSLLESYGLFKLSVIDTGTGMTGMQMVEFLNKLSSSIEEQSDEGNFGVGAKISALPSNPHGIVYQSWVHGKGEMIQLEFNQQTLEYGLKQFELSDGTFSEVLPLDESAKPSEIKDSGTKVILLGKNQEDNTMDPPSGTVAPSIYIPRYLATRYFRFPENITIKAREGVNFLKDQPERSRMRTVYGQESFLNQNNTSSGVVELSGAKAHWWILKNPEEKDQINMSATSGHIAALFNDELYDLIGGRGATAKLQEFGITFGCRYVVIYVEPVPGGARKISPNTARTQLLVNNEPLPWTEWAAEFSKKIPLELEKFIRKKSESLIGKDHSKSHRERLTPLLKYWNLSRYKRNINGTVSVDPSICDEGFSSDFVRSISSDSEKSFEKESKSLASRIGISSKDLFAIFEKKDGSPAKSVQPNVFPEIKWVSKIDGTRELGVLDDKAAKFLQNSNELHLNADFRGFTSLISMIHEDMCDPPPAMRPFIEDMVRSCVEQLLIETIVGVKALKGSREWSFEQINKALSEEALTAVVMQRYYLLEKVRRDLALKFGKKKSTQRIQELAIGN